MGPFTSLPERIQQRIEPEPNSGCWIWIGRRNPAGYGRTGPKLAHRVVYEKLVGPITDGEVDHLCKVRWCVNPSHMEIVPHHVNVDRGDYKSNHKNVKKTHCPEGHPYDVFREKWRGCRTCINKNWMNRWREKNGR